MTPYIALDLKIPSDIAQVERVVKLATDLCHALRLPSTTCTLNVPVALSEAVSNAILRGNREDPGKQVRIQATVSDQALTFDVTDEGPGFSIDQSLQDPILDDLEREDGRGLFLMQQLTTKIDQFRGDRGNVVRLTIGR